MCTNEVPKAANIVKQSVISLKKCIREASHPLINLAADKFKFIIRVKELIHGK